MRRRARAHNTPKKKRTRRRRTSWRLAAAAAATVTLPALSRAAAAVRVSCWGLFSYIAKSSRFAQGKYTNDKRALVRTHKPGRVSGFDAIETRAHTRHRHMRSKTSCACLRCAVRDVSRSVCVREHLGPPSQSNDLMRCCCRVQMHGNARVPTLYGYLSPHRCGQCGMCAPAMRFERRSSFTHTETDAAAAAATTKTTATAKKNAPSRVAVGNFSHDLDTVARVRPPLSFTALSAQQQQPQQPLKCVCLRARAQRVYNGGEMLERAHSRPRYFANVLLDAAALRPDGGKFWQITHTHTHSSFDVHSSGRMAFVRTAAVRRWSRMHM